MEFSYQGYLDAIHVQIACGTFVMIWGLGVLIWFCKEKKKKLFPAIFAVTIFIVLMTPIVKCLLNGGISLLTEKADDAVEKGGIIESICEPSKRLPSFRSGHDHGADVVIDGEVYFVATCEGFEVGDLVTISYLPKSRFILGIYHDGNEKTPAVSQNTAVGYVPIKLCKPQNRLFLGAENERHKDHMHFFGGLLIKSQGQKPFENRIIG